MSHPLDPRPSRRSFLYGATLTAAAAITGCSSSASTLREFELGGADRLRIYSWDNYLEPNDVEAGVAGTVADAERALALSIDYKTGYVDNIGEWNDLFVPALSQNRTLPYDIVVPTYWLAGRLAERNWLEAIPLEIMPNHANIEPAYLTQSWDRGARFNVPWQAGITGIAYNPTATGRRITSIADLFDPAFKGRVGIIGEMRETVPFGMLLNGDDPTRPTEATASAGLERFEDAWASGQITTTTFEDFADLLDSGDLDLAMAWSGDAVQLQARRPDIEFVIPEEGAVRWFDTMIVPLGAPNVAAAGAWMNHVYDPAVAAQITQWVQYISPVIGVREELDRIGGDAAELARNPILFPDDETKRRLFTWGGLPLDVEDQLEDRFAVFFGEE